MNDKSVKTLIYLSSTLTTIFLAILFAQNHAILLLSGSIVLGIVSIILAWKSLINWLIPCLLATFLLVTIGCLTGGNGLLANLALLSLLIFFDLSSFHNTLKEVKIINHKTTLIRNHLKFLGGTILLSLLLIMISSIIQLEIAFWGTLLLGIMIIYTLNRFISFSSTN